jgi:ribosomal protein S18 acetylase RimI-like enzyme
LVRVARAGAARISEVEELWKGLHRQHLAVDPRLPGVPIRSLEDSWRRRRRLYRRWLAEKEAFLLLAEDRGRAVGYAVVHLHEADESWDTGGRFGVLESIAVAPRRRGAGLGRKLMEAVFAELRTLRVDVLEIGVVSTNQRARRFYESLGFRSWLTHYLGRLPPDETTGAGPVRVPARRPGRT